MWFINAKHLPRRLGWVMVAILLFMLSILAVVRLEATRESPAVDRVGAAQKVAVNRLAHLTCTDFPSLRYSTEEASESQGVNPPSAQMSDSRFSLGAVQLTAAGCTVNYHVDGNCGGQDLVVSQLTSGRWAVRTAAGCKIQLQPGEDSYLLHRTSSGDPTAITVTLTDFKGGAFTRLTDKWWGQVTHQPVPLINP